MAKEKICGIYKISFINSDKVYIGQSVNIYRRITEHWMSARATEDNLNARTQRDYLLPIHRAMRKYGTQETVIEIIERCTREELDKKERQWIAYYHSDDKAHGYNLAHGGQQSFALSGERHSQAKITEKQCANIKSLLRDSQYTMREIADKYHLAYPTITDINKGKIWYEPNINYPIRKDSHQIGTQAVQEKRHIVSYEEAYEMRKLYSQTSLHEVHTAYSQYKPGTINRVIYKKGTCYDAVPFYDKKNRQWINLKEEPVSTIPQV